MSSLRPLRFVVVMVEVATVVIAPVVSGWGHNLEQVLTDDVDDTCKKWRLIKCRFVHYGKFTKCRFVR
jgi:hypothetical protein